MILAAHIMHILHLVIVLARSQALVFESGTRDDKEDDKNTKLRKS